MYAPSALHRSVIVSPCNSLYDVKAVNKKARTLLLKKTLLWLVILVYSLLCSLSLSLWRKRCSVAIALPLPLLPHMCQWVWWVMVGYGADDHYYRYLMTGTGLSVRLYSNIFHSFLIVPNWFCTFSHVSSFLFFFPNIRLFFHPVLYFISFPILSSFLIFCSFYSFIFCPVFFFNSFLMFSIFASS